MITVKTEIELNKMRVSGKIVGDALKLIAPYIKPGISTLELDGIIEEFILSQGAKPSFKNYNGFPNSTCISIDDVVVHGIPGLRVLKEGEIVSIDVGAFKDGYHGDAARTFAVGKISEQKQKLIDVTKQCFFEGMKEARAGKRLGDVSAAIQEYAEKNGCGVVRQMVGHGIGKILHEDPSVPNYGIKNSGVVLKKGFTLAVEPMITAGRYEITIDKVDRWTCKTLDHSAAAHYENTIIITDGEPELLTI